MVLLGFSVFSEPRTVYTIAVDIPNMIARITMRQMGSLPSPSSSDVFPSVARTLQFNNQIASIFARVGNDYRFGSLKTLFNFFPFTSIL